MKQFFVAGVIAAGLLGLPCAAPGVDVDINIGVPAPPQILFHEEPEVVVVPRTQVYYVPVVTSYDMYRYGNSWYVNHDGYWYRSRSYRGPFKFVEYRQIPHQIIVVPVEYRRYPAHPPKGPKKHRGHGHGHGHGHDDDD